MRSADDIEIVDDETNFPDSMVANWDASRIAPLLFARIFPSKPKSAPEPQIDVLLTFDAHGISNHPNHISLYHGARSLLSNVRKAYPGYCDPVAAYALTSVGVLRKYASVLDVPMTVVRTLVSGKEGGKTPSPLVSVSGVAEWRRSRSAMTEMHRSQMVWFRWGWIGASRYMVVNDLRRIRL